MLRRKLPNVVIIFLALLSIFLCEKGLTSQPTQKSSHLSSRADKVIVYKSERLLEVLRHGKVIGSYKVALGRSPKGHKQKIGDNKTPEGNYILDWRHQKSTFYKSLHISYPNREDRIKAAQKGVSPGGDIFLHGTSKFFSFLGKLHTYLDWTRGCIAVTNDEIDEILKLVKDGTPIEIRP